MRRLRPRLPLEAVVAAFLGSLLGAALVGAHGGDETLLHGCHQGPGTPLRVIAATETCGPNDIAVDWRSRGPAGATGPTGPAGTTGAPGPRGPSGAPGAPGPGHRFRVVRVVFTRGGIGQTLSVPCAPGERAVAGGMANSGGATIRPYWSRPSADGRSWDVRAAGGDLARPESAWALEGHAVCAREVPR